MWIEYGQELIAQVLLSRSAVMRVAWPNRLLVLSCKSGWSVMACLSSDIRSDGFVGHAAKFMLGWTCAELTVTGGFILISTVTMSVSSAATQFLHNSGKCFWQMYSEEAVIERDVTAHAYCEFLVEDQWFQCLSPITLKPKFWRHQWCYCHSHIQLKRVANWFWVP
jgi:hypothetical protein